MAGYIRQDEANTIQNGNVADATIIDEEFDAIQSAFSSSTGHNHDGTTGGGAPILVVGPAQDVVVSATEMRPKTDNTLDLGTSSFEWKDLYVDGTANIDSLVADTADINGGTIDGTTIGATTPAAVSATTITASGTITGNVTGNLTGNVTGDVTGNTAGVHTGNVTGNLTGNVTGNVTGDTTGTHTGAVVGTTGSFSGAVTLNGSITLNANPTGTGVQSTPIDDTSGKLLTVGAFGMGVDSTDGTPQIADATIDAHDITGLFSYDAGIPYNGVGPAYNAALLTMAGKNSSSLKAQLYIESSMGVNKPDFYWRASQAIGVYSDWKKVYHNENVVGTVEQNAGRNVGAIIEQGSNSNGEYTLYADGTLICWHSMLSNNAAETPWTFPASFIATPTGLFVTVRDTGTTLVGARITGGSLSTTGLEFSCLTAAGRVARTCYLMAIGRYF